MTPKTKDKGGGGEGHRDNNIVIQNIQEQKQSKHEMGKLKLFHSKPSHPKKFVTPSTSIENEYKTQTFVDTNLNLKHYLVYI